MLAPNAVISSPARTSFANPSQRVGSSSIDLPEYPDVIGIMTPRLPWVSLRRRWAAPPRGGALRWRRRLAARQDDDLAAAQYALAEERLGAAGYAHYELSSWSRPGFEARHNAAYWGRRPYTGIGAGAHSYDGAATRSWNTRDLDRYLAAVEAGDTPTADSEDLDEATRAFEAIALGLRRIEGLERRAFADEFGSDPIDRYAAAMAGPRLRDLVEVAGERLRLTAAGRLLASEVCEAFLPDAAA